MRILLILIILAALSGCTSSPAPAGEPPSVHIIHRYQNAHEPDSFVIAQNAGLVNVTVVIENFYRNRCPAPIGEIKLLEPGGATYASLKTENLPLQDCVYLFSKNETTLSPGRWTVQYSGGSEFIGSIVDVRASNVTKSN